MVQKQKQKKHSTLFNVNSMDRRICWAAAVSDREPTVKWQRRCSILRDHVTGVLMCKQRFTVAADRRAHVLDPEASCV